MGTYPAKVRKSSRAVCNGLMLPIDYLQCMGYMGFGMRKKTYSQKPRRPFGALKSYLSTTHPSPKREASNDAQPRANGPKKFFGSSVSNYFARPTFRSLLALAISTLLAGLILWVVIKLTYVALDPRIPVA